MTVADHRYNKRCLHLHVVHAIEHLRLGLNDNGTAC